MVNQFSQFINKFLIIFFVILFLNCNQSKKTDNTSTLGALLLYNNSKTTSTCTGSSSTLTVTSSVGASGSEMGLTYACTQYGGSAYNPDLSWSGCPSTTKEFALLMTTLDKEGILKYNWVLYSIPNTTTSLAKNSTNVGTSGLGSDGPTLGYQAPCSSGLGKKDYTFTIYALSSSPTLTSGTTVTGSVLSTAISSITAASGSITLSVTR